MMIFHRRGFWLALYFVIGLVVAGTEHSRRASSTGGLAESTLFWPAAMLHNLTAFHAEPLR